MRKYTLVLLFCILAALAIAGCAPATASPSAGTPEAYAPVIDPADFVAHVDNPYMPLTPGNVLVYEGQTDEGLERTEVRVLDETKVIMGLTATVVRDTVALDGQVIEDTHDYYAQDKSGAVWYLGETVDNYQNGVVANHEGSWEAGVDGALPGIVMQADPLSHVGEEYRQEYYPGKAEDMARVIGQAGPMTVPFGTFEDVAQTEDWNPLEPGVREHKFYARGVGLIKESDPDSGQSAELVESQTP